MTSGGVLPGHRRSPERTSHVSYANGTASTEPITGRERAERAQLDRRREIVAKAD